MVSVGSVTVDVVPDARNFDRDLSAKLNPAAEQAGKLLSDRIGAGIRDGLSPSDTKAPATRTGAEAGGAFADAFQKRVKAALAALPSANVDLNNEAAQAKLQFLHEELKSLSSQQVGVDLSDTEAMARLTAVRAELDNLAARSPSVQVKVDTARASAEVDRFLADTSIKTEVASKKMGDENGSMLAEGMRLSLLRNSPLIAAAVAGGLIAGAPLAIAGAGVLFGGIAAVAVKNNAQVHAATADMMNQVMAVFKDTAQVTVPMFVGALQSIGTAFQNLKPQFASAFSALGAPLGSLTAGVISLVQNAMPGLVTALHNAAPVFQGLASLMGAVGTGLGQFFALVSQHGAAAGQVFSSLGQIIGAALPILGRLIDVGVQLGSQILPPVASALGLVANVLGAIAPVLPVVVAGLGGLLIARSLQGPLSTLAQNLAFASYQGGALGQSAGLASRAVSGFGSALPYVGVAVGVVSDLMQKASDQGHQWAQALLDGGKAADTARSQMSNFGEAMKAANSGSTGFFTGLLGNGAQFGQTILALKDEKDAAKQLADSMSPLQAAQQKVTQAQNDYLKAVQDNHGDVSKASVEAGKLSDAQDHLKTVQGQLNAVTDSTDQTMAVFKGALQDTADAASAAKSQIKLLDDSLDALTGKTVTMDQAEVAITDATIAATTATKGKTGALVDATGALNLHTEAGAAAFTALNNLAGADNTLISTMEQQGATSDQVKAKDAQLRDSFIQTAEKMGFSAGQAQNLADQIYGIPAQRDVQINTNAADAKAAIKTVQDQIDNLHGRNVTIQILSSGNAGPAAYAVPGSGTGGFAGGGYTGDGAKYTPAGIVHAGEFVFPQESVNRLGVGFLGALAGLPGYAGGGPVPVNIHETAAPFNQALQAAANSARDSMFAGMGPSGSSGGAARWAGLVLQALGIMGQPASLLGSVLRRMNQESGGNPNAINLWDSNARAGDPSRGLMQVIGSTFARYHHGGTSFNIYDPMANVLASMDYAIARYGSLAAAYNRPGGYAAGTNYVPSDQLAYLHKGEAVVPASANQGAPWQDRPVHLTVQLDGPAVDDLFAGKVVTTLEAVISRGDYNG